LDTATSVTDARSRRALSQARKISASTDASALGKGRVTGEAFSGVMTVSDRRFTE
jgi:hypothetical protein